MPIIIAGPLGPVQYDQDHWNVVVYYDIVIVTSLRQENLNHYICIREDDVWLWGTQVFYFEIHLSSVSI